MRTIAQIWNGALEVAATSGENNQQLKELSALKRHNAEKLHVKLDEETLALFKRYCECAGEYDALVCEQAFCDGFSLGVRIMAEAMSGPESTT